jgi:biopolymer transport protein ExbD
MSPLRLVIVGIALFLLGFLILFLADRSQPPYDPFAEIRDTPEGLFLLGFLAMSFFAVGIFYFFRGIHMGLVGTAREPTLPRIFPEMRLRNLTNRNIRSFSPSFVIASLNVFSVSWISVLMTLVIIFMIFDSPRPRYGLYIDWLERSRVSVTGSPWPETMSVYIGSQNQFLVNGKPIRAEDLKAKLEEELGRRAEWTVYVEADPYSMFANTAHAIDTIQGLGGRVVWITPKMREAWKQ